MQTLQQVAGIKNDDAFFTVTTNNHWESRAKKLRERRWQALIAKDKESRTKAIMK